MMMKTRFTLAIVLAAFFILSAGCYPLLSLNPFYTDKDVSFDPDLLGMWLAEDTDETWEFTKFSENKYRVVISVSDGPQSFVAHLFEIRDTMYLNMYPARDIDIDNVLLIPTHGILQVGTTGSTMEIAEIDTEWLREYLKDNPSAISYTFVDDDVRPKDESDGILVLTSSTEELQDFIIKIRNIKGAFKKLDIKLYRKPEK
jgi:hypothetical protein